MIDIEGRPERLRRAIRAVPGWEDRTTAEVPALPVLASPSWRGVDATPLRIVDRASGETLFVKAMDPDAEIHADIAVTFAAAVRASDLGIGPRVHVADVEGGLLVMEDLAEGWRTATLDLLLDPAVVDRIHAARVAFQAGAPLGRPVGVLDEIERFHGEAVAIGAQLPNDIAGLMAEFGFAVPALRAAAAAAVPIHGDGNISNVMLGPDGEVRLVDWDRAADADPAEDLASFFVEAFAQEPEARDAFARLTGGFDRRAFDRVRLLGIADDLRWGLISALVAAKSPRRTMEFYKFASWRFERCRLSLRDPRFGEMVRRIG